MTAPPRRVLTVPESAHCRPIEDVFDPPAQPAGGHSFALPQRFEHLHDQIKIDIRDRRAAKHRIDVSRQRAGPLLLVLAAFPTVAVRCDVTFGALPERHHPHDAGTLCRPQAAPLLDRIDAVEPQLAALPLSGISAYETDRVS